LCVTSIAILFELLIVLLVTIFVRLGCSSSQPTTDIKAEGLCFRNFILVRRLVDPFVHFVVWLLWGVSHVCEMCIAQTLGS
jgi:hypothetical protein